MRHEIRAALERAEREAAAQFGLLRYDEARRCGLSRDTGRRLVRDRRWQLAMPSAFSVTTGELEPVRLRAAAVLSLRPLASDEHPPVALHGVSALQLECVRGRGRWATRCCAERYEPSDVVTGPSRRLRLPT
ncbi:MAG TPA: hypothetical protein VEZ46_14775 [Mycobacteriales bacterium]|nr:hypothetical protein [Mycobacteriales bacterium]